MSGPADVVVLLPVDAAVLADLVQVATTDAAADEVTPPDEPTNVWTPRRVAWLREFHRGRRTGLDGPAGEATWAVLVDGSVVGAVRLRRTADDGVLETGIWLARAARGRGAATPAIAAVLERAAVAGAHAVRADTTAGNAAALAVLAALGFTLRPGADGRTVQAMLRL